MKFSRKSKLMAFAVGVFLCSIVAALWVVNNLQKQQVSLDSHRVFLGRVSEPASVGMTKVILWNQSKGGEVTILGSLHPGQAGLFAFLLEFDSLPNILAYHDRNTNGALDPGEPYWSDQVGPLFSDAEASGRESTRGQYPEIFDIQLASGRASDKLLRRVSANSASSGNRIPIVFGEVSKMDDPRLGEKYGIRGLWRSRADLNQRGIGVYALEKINHQKTPIIFVHGAAGSPQDFATMIDAVDTSRNQVWVFSYPSGLPLSAAADALNRITVGLAGRHNISKLHIVAHSMGGLVARRALEDMRQSGHSSLVQRFVSISTPYGGHQAAKHGVERSPIKINSWFDIAPDSAFLNGIAEAPPVEHHFLVYGTKAKKRLSLPDQNDGVVSVQSQLFEPIKSAADQTMGFELDHRGILESETVIDAVLDYLNGSKH